MEHNSITIKVDRSGVNKRLDVFLGERISSTSRSHIKKLIEEESILVNGAHAKAHYKLKEGDVLVIDFSREKKAPALLPENIPLEIPYEDEYLLVVNKPAGMAAHPSLGITSGTLVNALLYHCKQLSNTGSGERPGIVHRLDKDTSGLMVVAKDNETHGKLAKQFKERQIKKKYIAVVNGLVELDQSMIELPIGRHPSHRQKLTVRFSESRDAITQYQVLKRFNNSTLLELTPKTGRMHQLRVHLSYIGHPIVGDAVYGQKSDLIGRQALHALTLGFTHPVTGKYLEFTSQIPEDIKRLLQ